MNPFRPGSTRFPPHSPDACGDDPGACGNIRRYPVSRHDDGHRRAAAEAVLPAPVR